MGSIQRPSAHSTPPAEPLLAAPLFSMCNVPPWALADVSFQDSPQPLSLWRVRQNHHHFFSRLETEPDPARRGEMFHEYISVAFSLHHWSEHKGRARAVLRNSYVRFLCGWQADSNSMEGAVLKGWVHSRFGLPPNYHITPLTPSDISSGKYAVQRIRGSNRTNAIHSQLDLLYEFCQSELARRHPGKASTVLYRGVTNASSYSRPPGVLDPVCNPRESIVRLNNLSSFTSDRECAWEFGSTVWEARVPFSKILFFSSLLPSSLLSGESEFMVIGGDYRVKSLLF